MTGTSGHDVPFALRAIHVPERLCLPSAALAFLPTLAGLTARARPEARPGRRAANLQEQTDQARTAEKVR